MRPIFGIRKQNGSLEITDTGTVNILNEHYSTIGKKLATCNKCQTSSIHNQEINIHCITPTIAIIDLSHEIIVCALWRNYKRTRLVDQIKFRQNCWNFWKMPSHNCLSCKCNNESSLGHFLYYFYNFVFIFVILKLFSK